jgi:DNA topoisomerase-1
MTISERLKTTGIIRVGSSERGFRYRRADGRRLEPRDRERIRALVIPPAWTDVYVNPSSMAPIQAIGKDAAGRLQYLYHEVYVRRREKRKSHRLAQFIEALPRLRRAVARDLDERGLAKKQVLAVVVSILSSSFLRPGSGCYAEENGSYGLVTLERRHVRVSGDTIRLAFPGKSGQRQERVLRDRRLAHRVRAILRLPGRRVFKFESEDGSVYAVRRRHVNEYIKEAMGGRFSAKDFRTWAGTLICACVLARDACETAGKTSRTAMTRRVASAIRETAQFLGNTPAVCRASYVSPALLERYERGEVVAYRLPVLPNGQPAERRALERCERALLALLRGRPADFRAGFDTPRSSSSLGMSLAATP